MYAELEAESLANERAWDEQQTKMEKQLHDQLVAAAQAKEQAQRAYTLLQVSPHDMVLACLGFGERPALADPWNLFTRDLIADVLDWQRCHCLAG